MNKISKKDQLKKDLDNVTQFISQVDPSVQRMYISDIKVIKSVISKWNCISLKPSVNDKHKDHILESLEEMLSFFSSPKYFSKEDYTLRIKKDETREKYNKVANELKKLRIQYFEHYFLLFFSNTLQRIEIAVIKAIYNAIKLREEDPLRLSETSEEHFRNDIYDIIRTALDKKIYISKETPTGFSKVKIGETDLYLGTYINDLYKQIAIGEVKESGKFVKQIGQLLGYMNPSTHFGFTIILNKHTKLESVQNTINNTLESFKEKDDNDVLKVWAIEDDELGMENTFVSIHLKPETGTLFKIYHFIAHTYLPERRKVAIQARK